jgi:DNA-3-methyladenine glycosylase
LAVSSSNPRRAALLPVAFFRRPTRDVARDLIGCVIESSLGRARTLGRIVETEAYLGHRDPASHGYANRRHAQNEHLYAPAGTWYVYRSYGVHWCANLVCEREVNAGAVLLRAVEPLEGLRAMARRRGGVDGDRLLASGPGRLTQALAIDRSLDGVPMRESRVRIYRADTNAEVASSPRIGITRAVDWPLRFTEAGSRYLSRSR